MGELRDGSAGGTFRGYSCRRRLEAPNGLFEQTPVGAARQPTYDNLVAALQDLAGPQVQHSDHVFIYYSGHGSIETLSRAETYFEGLVPVDQKEKGLLFDIELNRLLRDLADCSGDLTVIHEAAACSRYKSEVA